MNCDVYERREGIEANHASNSLTEVGFNTALETPLNQMKSVQFTGKR